MALLVAAFRKNPTGPFKDFIDAENEDMCTPLHLAAYYGNAQAVSTLLEAGEADVYKVDEDGNDALTISCGALAMFLLSVFPRTWFSGDSSQPDANSQIVCSEKCSYV